MQKRMPSNATRILYSGCPLCLEEDTCNLCFEFKLNKWRAPGDRWATRNLKDHAPISPPETLSASRILFMEKMGHVFDSGSGANSKKKRGKKTNDKKATCQGKKTGEKRTAAGGQRSRTAKHRQGKRKESSSGAAESKQSRLNFTVEGYPRESSEYEPSEGKIVYRPPGYGQSKEDKHDGIIAPHCDICHLKPCLATAWDQRFVIAATST
ncbi:expressed unknown protein [Seminavis robusta]|uniref:Uncharacterized protein n=1 Tax=Seminavis robusta TaxID=568900 RepID=A0A9N8DNB3_9STRA|nr:expressed unknown protein [Seminavis robusta]|eukprot:Sro173_g076452.1  (210) ;mRNA; f:95309-95938